MTLTLSVPSKTFLVGEYAVLCGGPAIVLNTAPRFKLIVRPGSGAVSGVPEGSQAHKWLQQARPLLTKWDITFQDPHTKQGGFGASSAQFIMAHALTTLLQSSFERALEGPALKDIWNDHQVLTSHRGSGADVLGQYTGGIAHVEPTTLITETLAWPYPELSFAIVRTHQKVATHEHLKGLERAALSLLVRPAQECVESFGRSKPEVFVGYLKAFASALRELKLQAPPTQSLVKLLESEDWCLAAKGCGALGADTVLCIYPADQREKVNTLIRKQSLQLVATRNDLSAGLEVKWSVADEG